jgi:hypothetical protein
MEWDWPQRGSLLWVFDDGTALRVCQDFQYPPLRLDDPESEGEIEAIFSCHPSVDGGVYVAVKWRDKVCPTWELEDDVSAALLPSILPGIAA